MAAGQGFKTFATGDVLSAADVNGYLMQGVLVFATAAARDAAITAPAQGQTAYLKSDNLIYTYNGSAWTNSVGDITAVTTASNSGLAGGATAGAVALTLNTAAKGDLLAGTGSGTASALTVGANGTTLVADSTASTGLKWAAAADGAGSWTNYTPTITAEAGTFTSVTSQAGRYQMLNSKTCLVQAVWRVATVGTAVGKTKFTIPFTANASAQTAVGSARETESTGFQGWVSINASATFAETARYDNVTFAVNAYTVRTQIVYEVA